MRFLALLAVSTSLAASAFASYELILVSDAGSDSVRRFDPYSGASLGSFGAGYLVDPKGVAVDAASGRAVVVDGASGTRLSYWDYSTGTLISAVPIGATVSYMNQNRDGSFNLTFANTIGRFTFDGASIRTYSPQGGWIATMGSLHNDGRFYLFGSQGQNKVFQSQDAATGALFATGNWITDRFVSGVGNLAFNAYVSSSTSVGFERDNVAGTLNAQAASLMWGYDKVSALAVGHWPVGYATIRSTGGVWEIKRYDITSNMLLSPFAVGGLTDPTGMAIVVAPEPATLTALALGALALLRRRRRLQM